jgi:hypothetical protein
VDGGKVGWGLENVGLGEAWDDAWMGTSVIVQVIVIFALIAKEVRIPRDRFNYNPFVY